jgi:hypothetical protein
MTSAIDGLCMDVDKLFALWSTSDNVITLRKGLICAKVSVPNPNPSARLSGGSDATLVVYLINGFYGALRNSFIFPGSSCNYMVIEWDETQMSWSHLVSDVIGHRDPDLVNPTSIRGCLYEQWKDLDITKEPSEMNNYIHVSKSAFAGIVDRLIWMRAATLDRDVIAKRFITCGISLRNLQRWSLNAYIAGKGDVYELTKYKGTRDSIEELRAFETQ